MKLENHLFVWYVSTRTFLVRLESLCARYTLGCECASNFLRPETYSKIYKSCPFEQSSHSVKW